MSKERHVWLAMRLLFPPRDFPHRRRRVIGSIALVALVMIPLVLSLLFMDGMISAMTKKYVTLQDGHIQSNTLLPEDVERTLIDSVYSIDSVTVAYGIVYSRDATNEARFKGVYPSYFNPVRLDEITYEGTLLAKDQSLAPVMLSTTMAKKLKITVGDRVALMLVPESGNLTARPMFVYVSGLFDSGYRQLDENLVFMHFDDLAKTSGTTATKRTEFLVKEAWADELDSVIDSLKDTYDPDARYLTWESFNQSVYQNFVTSRQVILLVFVMIGFVAASYVASIAHEMVQDNHREIALLKALGASSRSIHKAFALVVGSITVTGLVFGITIGLAIGTRLGSMLSALAKADIPALRYYLLDFPVEISWLSLIQAIAVLLIISAVTVLFALRRIRKISVLELLQQE
jgi:lipoprotein-releasing system permease protein